jgi:hypothetical protein
VRGLPVFFTALAEEDLDQIRVYTSARDPDQRLSLYPDFRFQRFSVSVFPFVPAEQRALGLVLTGGEFDQAPDKVGPTLRPLLFQLCQW